MKKLQLLALLTVLSLHIFAQDYGTLYSTYEATQRFGEVELSQEISKDELESIMDSSPSILMFQFVNNDAYVFSDAKTVLFGNAVNQESIGKYYVYSTSKVAELLKLAKTGSIFLEKRGDYLTISMGGYTLENAALCPPFCK